MSQTITPKEPDPAFVNGFFPESLLLEQRYALESHPEVVVKLDQNESPFDWPLAVKQKVLKELAAISWNRYPDPFGAELTEILAKRMGISSELLLTGPGSNHLIALFFETLGPYAKDIVVARPSFALFESQCRYSGLSFTPWELDEHLEYSIDSLPPLKDGSLVVFASPNNPTGSSLPVKDFEALLARYPKVLFLTDEAYYEFSDESYQPLLEHYSNFVILRTLSKTMGAAGIRLGYLMGAKAWISTLAKKRLPYLLNQFTLVAAKSMLTDPQMEDFVQAHVEHVKKERARVFAELVDTCTKKSILLKNSAANFLLTRFPSHEQALKAHKELVSHQIMVRNVSKGVGLKGCLRVSLGTKEENDRLIYAFKYLN